jgi:hypothetical protein
MTRAHHRGKRARNIFYGTKLRLLAATIGDARTASVSISLTRAAAPNYASLTKGSMEAGVVAHFL